MISRNRILSLTAVLAFGLVSAFAAGPQTAVKPATSASTRKSATKVRAPKEHVMRGSVVVVTEKTLTLRSGRKDYTFEINPATQRPTSLSPGSDVRVNYHDEGIQHIAGSIQLSAPKTSALAAKQKASK